MMYLLVRPKNRKGFSSVVETKLRKVQRWHPRPEVATVPSRQDSDKMVQDFNGVWIRRDYKDPIGDAQPADESAAVAPCT